MTTLPKFATSVALAAVSPRSARASGHERGENCGPTPGGQQIATVLSPAEEAIAQRVAALVAPVKPGPVLTRAEAMAHTKHGSDTAFDRWCQRLRVKPCARGRYARGHLDRALLREAGPGARAA